MHARARAHTHTPTHPHTLARRTHANAHRIKLSLANTVHKYLVTSELDGYVDIYHKPEAYWVVLPVY